MTYSNELYHHGVKGMKWGVRRYENPDGTLTEAGKKRYSKERERASLKKQRKSKWKAVKNRSLLSEKDLEKKIRKLELEKKLKNLTEEQLAPGRAATKKILADVGKRVASTILAGGSLYAIKKLITNKAYSKSDPSNKKKRQINWEELGNALFNGGPKKK